MNTNANTQPNDQHNTSETDSLVSRLEGRLARLERSNRRGRGLLMLAGGVIAGMVLAGFAQPQNEEKAAPVGLAVYETGNDLYMVRADGTVERVSISALQNVRGGQVPWRTMGR